MSISYDPVESFRYALQWESKNLIAVSTAIQDWLTSSNLFGTHSCYCLLIITVMASFVCDLQISVNCCRHCTVNDEAGCHVDCIKHANDSFGLAGNTTCSYRFHRQQMDYCSGQVFCLFVVLGMPRGGGRHCQFHFSQNACMQWYWCFVLINRQPRLKLVRVDYKS